MRIIATRSNRPSSTSDPKPSSTFSNPKTRRAARSASRASNVDGHFEWDLSVFRMDFNNLVVAQDVDGLPATHQRRQGEVQGRRNEARWNFGDGISVVGTYAYHDARFGSYVQRGRRRGASERQGQPSRDVAAASRAASASCTRRRRDFARTRWPTMSASAVSTRTTTSASGDYTTFDAGLGYAWDRWEVRVDGYNLSDRRDPIAESELGPRSVLPDAGTLVLADCPLHVRRALRRDGWGSTGEAAVAIRELRSPLRAVGRASQRSYCPCSVVLSTVFASSADFTAAASAPAGRPRCSTLSA